MSKSTNPNHRQQQLDYEQARVPWARSRLIDTMPSYSRPYSARYLAGLTPFTPRLILKALTMLKGEGKVTHDTMRGWRWVYSAAERKARKEMQR